MEVAELAPGLWRWSAPHPDWTPEEGADGWAREVACLYVEAPDAIVLVDPLVPRGPDGERFHRHLDADLARAGRPVAILLTTFWHERSAAELAARHGAEVWAPERSRTRLAVALDRPFRPGDPLPGGIEARATPRFDEVALWVPRERALVFGDAVLGAGGGELRLCPEHWLHDVEPEAFRASLRRLLDLPAELVLPAHGEPVLAGGRAALRRALG